MLQRRSIIWMGYGEMTAVAKLEIEQLFAISLAARWSPPLRDGDDSFFILYEGVPESV